MRSAASGQKSFYGRAPCVKAISFLNAWPHRRQPERSTDPGQEFVQRAPLLVRSHQVKERGNLDRRQLGRLLLQVWVAQRFSDVVLRPQLAQFRMVAQLFYLDPA